MNKKYNGKTYVWELSLKARSLLYKMYKKKFGNDLLHYYYDINVFKNHIDDKLLIEVESDFNFILVYDLCNI